MKNKLVNLAFKGIPGQAMMSSFRRAFDFEIQTALGAYNRMLGTVTKYPRLISH